LAHRLWSARYTLALILVLTVGAALRFWNLGWDGGAYTFHPDEWALNEVVRNLGPDLHPHFFFYGSLPVYLYRGTAEALSALTGLDWLEPGRLVLVGRALSALASTATLLLLFLVGRQLWGRGAGLVAAALGAGSVLLVQAAHFGTVESLLSLQVTALLLLSLRIADGAGRSTYALAGVVWGLALATKLTAASFLLLPLVAHVVRRTKDEGRRREDVGSGAGEGDWAYLPPLLFGACALIAVFLSAPYYLLAWQDLWAAVREQSDELAGSERFPYTWQFEGATPYLFELHNLVVWGLGPALGIAALTGWGRAIFQLAARAVRHLGRTRTAQGERGVRDIAHLRTWQIAILAIWPILYFLYVGTWEARFVRHLVPLVPFCALFAVYALLWLKNVSLRRIVGGMVLAATAVWALSFLSIYTAEDSRLQATGWIAENVPPGSTIVVEDKNDLIPVPGTTYPTDRHEYGVLRVTETDTPDKALEFARVLASGDYLVVPNRRWSGVLQRLERFPLMGRYYRLLFSGELGYREVALFSNPPRLGPLEWDDDGAEETFQVFDHPTVRVFRNDGRLSEEQLRELLLGNP
jgi:hypothetical protein